MSIEMALPIALGIAVFGLIAMAVITGVRRGWDPDVTGSRARALYIYGVVFVALVIVAFSISSLAAAIVRIILPSHLLSVSPLAPVGGSFSDKVNANEAVMSGLFAIAGLIVFLFQYRRGNEALGEPGWLDTAAGRIRRGYLYLGSFVWILIALFAGVIAVFGLYQIVVPGTAGLGAPNSVVRDSGIVQLVSLGLLALIALGAFVAHWQRLRPRRGPLAEGSPGAVPSAPPPPAPHHAPPPTPPAPAG